MIVLFFNSNSSWFLMPQDTVFGIHIQDGDLFTVRCLCYSWPVSDLYHQWGVADFPDQTPVRIANFKMHPAHDDEANWKDPRVQSEGGYWVLLYPKNQSGNPIPVLVDNVNKQFFGVATDHETAKRLEKVEDKVVWITVVAKTVTFNSDIWPELSVYREGLGNWAKASVRID